MNYLNMEVWIELLQHSDSSMIDQQSEKYLLLHLRLLVQAFIQVKKKDFMMPWSRA